MVRTPEETKIANRESARKWAKSHPDRVRENQLKYRKAHPDRVREREQKYRESCRERIKETRRKYREVNAEVIREKDRVYSQKWRKEHPEQACRINRENNKRYRQKLKDSVFVAYGGCCACCGETDSRFFTIDHMDNSGATHRKILGRDSKKLYKWLINNNYPVGFQILCWNCNSGKACNNGICPHKDPK